MMISNSLGVFSRKIEEHHNPDIVYGNLIIVDKEGEPIEHDSVNRKEIPESTYDYWELFLYGFAQLGAMCIKRSFFFDIGMFNHDLFGWDDRDFQYRVLLSTKRIVFVDDRCANLDPAARLKMKTVLVGPEQDGHPHLHIGHLTELTAVIPELCLEPFEGTDNG